MRNTVIFKFFTWTTIIDSIVVIMQQEKREALIIQLLELLFYCRKMKMFSILMPFEQHNIF